MTFGEQTCAICMTRKKKCDGTRPVCQHCARDRVKCGDHPNLRDPIRGVYDPRTLPSPPVSTINILDLAPSEPVSGPALASNILGIDSRHPSDWPNVKNTFSSHLSYGTPTRHFGMDSTLTRSAQHSISFAQILQQAPSTRDYLTNIGSFDDDSRKPILRKKDEHQPVDPEQAGLPGVSGSLAQSVNNRNSLESPNTLYRPPLVESYYNLGRDFDQAEEFFNQSDLEDSQTMQGFGARLCNSLALDKKVESNTLPFILQCYALWIERFLFEPVRVIPLARVYISKEYSAGPEARWRMLTASNATRAITGSTSYTLEDLEALQSHMYRGFAAAVSNFGGDRQADRLRALPAMSTTYEFISGSVKVFPLSQLVKTMQAVAPIFRCACLEPGDRLVNLPNLLSEINLDLEHYATVDIILSAVISRPMNIRYDTTFALGFHEALLDLENGPGMRWVYGLPDRLLIILARMNALLEDFGSGVDPEVIQELELEIKQVKPIVLASADPGSSVGRLVVQECWRQAAYIYLYMGLCGADSHDARIMNVCDNFMKLLLRAKPGRIPDSFLVLPLPILGIAVRNPDDQESIKRRMLAVPEVARTGTSGNQFLRMLECIWDLANESGRPANWSDLRMASLLIAGA